MIRKLIIDRARARINGCKGGIDVVAYCCLGLINTTTILIFQHYCFTIKMLYRVFIKYCVFSEFLKIFLWPFSAFPRCQCVYTHQAGRKPALQQNWQSSEKSQHFKEKTQYLMNTLYIIYYVLYFIYS